MTQVKEALVYCHTPRTSIPELKQPLPLPAT